MSSPKKYKIVEVFLSLQGEGVRAGCPSVFIRFTGCNLRCSVEEGEKSPGGFDCDTEFMSGRDVTLEELEAWIYTAVCISTDRESTPLLSGTWLVLTGGEPALQVDAEFCRYFHERGYFIAIETNGSIALPVMYDDGTSEGRCPFDWITVSPKVAEHAIRQLEATEVKYVRAWGQGIPKTVVKADYYLISPAFDGDAVHPKTLDWCIRLVLQNPQWRLSCQQHKFWNVR